MKRALSVLLSLLIAMNMFVGIDFTAYANDTAVAITANNTEFPYDDADVYVADCIIKGMIDKEGNINDNVISLNIALNKQYTYELIAKELVDDELLMFNSLYWQNIKKTLSADFVSMANWEEELCILLIIDYLNYYGQTEEFESNYIKNSIKFTETIYEGVMDYVADEYDNAKGPVNQILATMSVEEAKELTEKWGFTKDIKKYTALGNDLQTITTSATQYYKNLTKALSVQRADEARIDFLKRLKIAGNSNTTFMNAVDKVIAMYESSYATLALGEGTRTMLNHGMSVLFSEAKKACPEATAIIDSLKTYNEGLNWLFNSDDISENNLKLVLIYTIGNYAKSSVRSARDAFTANPTVENAQTFISTYEGYLKYQEYASESTKGFVSSALFDGVFNQIKGWFTDKNVETYKDFIELLDSNINICYSLERLDQQYYDLYYEIVDYDCSAFAEDDSSGSENIPVTSVSFRQPEITLSSTDDICLIYAEIYPANATNKKVKYTCSDESILSVPVNGGFATQKGTGIVTVTATTEDGRYTATQTVYVGDYTTSEVTANGTCGDNLQWTLYNNGTLVISGTGDMKNYAYNSYTPWYNRRASIKSVKIGNGVTSIGYSAFGDCTSLLNITISESVKSIGDGAFENCENLTNIIIGDGVTSIGDWAFENCTSLLNITISERVKSIGDRAFEGCDSLTNVYISNLKAWCEIDFCGIHYANYDGLYSNPLSYADNLYLNNELVTDIIIPQGVTTLQPYVFSCTNITSITISESVTSIDYSAFSGCDNLITVNYNAMNCTFEGSNHVAPFGSCEFLSVVNIGENVKSIPSYAFEDCKSLIGITIPENITSIGHHAFLFCDNLKSVTIGNGVRSIGESAFAWCENLTNIAIPESVTTIGGGAFERCESLTNVYISDITAWCKIDFDSNPLSYADNLYLNNELVTDIVIPSAVTVISDYAFSGCGSLTNITISDSVTTIGDEAFSSCYNLKSVTIGNGVRSIGESAFAWCENLTNIAIPENVTTIDVWAFYGCDNLTDVYYTGTEEQWKNISIGDNNECLKNDATIHYGKVSRVEATGITVNKTNLYLNVGKTEMIVPTIQPFNTTNKTITWTSSDNSVAKVENGKVTGISTGTATITAKTSNGLTATCTVTVTNVSWTLDNGTLTINGNGIIEDNSFAARSDIKKVVIQNGITGIGEYAFYNCKNIESVVLGNGVKDIGYRAFLQCDKLKSVTLGNNVKTIGEGAFYNCPALSSISIPDSVTDIGNNAFYHCLNLKTISVSNNIERIGKEVFYNTAFYNDDSKWVNNALYLNNYLVHVRDSISGNYLIKNGTICIADKVFSGYSNLTEVTIPDSVLYMGNWTFSDCTNLRKVTIGKSVRSIGYDTFSGCVNLENITIPSSVKSIGDFAFFDCYKLSKIIIPNSVTEIGENAFSNCSNLSSVTIGNGITEIKKQTFDGCTGLKTINFGNNLEYIGERAFKSCSNLKSVSIPNTVTVLGESAFENCIRLENITIGNNVKLIGNYAFWNSEGLSSVTIGTGVTDIGDGAFGGCPEIKDVYYDSYESQWNSIVIGHENEDLLNANIHFKTLEQVDVTGITLNKKSISLIVGQSENLTATVLPSNATDTNITWTSSNSKIVTVNNGKITGINVGTAKITAKTSNNISATCFVTVSPTSNMKEIVGDVNFDGVVNIIDATEVQRHLAKFIEFSDVQKNVADTNGDSILNIIDATEIQRYLAKYIDHFKQPSSISLNTNSITLVVGNTQTLSANILPNDATNKTVSWFSSNNSIATVTYGVVTAKAPGTAIITAKTYNGKTTECTITVKEKTIDVTGIKLNSNGISLNTGNTYQLVATITPENATNKNIIWSTNDASIATVSSNGKITAVSIGKTTITAKASNGVTATCTVNVVPVQVSSISLSDTNEVLYLGFTHFLTATVKPDNANDKTLMWSSSDTSVVTVSSSGTVTAKGLGTATVTAKSSNGILASCIYTVKSMIEPESVEFSVERLTLTEGSSYDLYYSVLPANADNKTLEWSSSNDSWVNVNQNGKITAVKSGVMATITAETANGKKDTVIVDVVRKASEYGKYLSLGLKTDTGILPPAITPNNPSYSTIRGDDLYFISDIDSELYQGARLNMYVTSGSSGTYATYNFTLGAENAKYDYKTDKGYISISKYLNWHRGQYIRVYSEIILANGQVVKHANLGTDDAIYLYMHPSY